MKKLSIHITLILITFISSNVYGGKLFDTLTSLKKVIDKVSNEETDENQYEGQDNIVNNGNKVIKRFSKSKKLLPKIYKGHEVTIYCGCKYKGKKPNFKSCGYKPKKDNKRANRIEWEHIVPAHAFGHSFKEWRVGSEKCVNKKGKKFKGRKCAGKNKTFALMEADLYNLYPAIGEVNGLRSNYPIAEIPGEKREFGSCDVEIYKKKMEPSDQVKGNVARTYMYMEKAYPGRGIISKKNKKLIAAWDKLDPVDKWECERSKKIQKIQKNTNQVLNKACKDKGF